MTDYMIEKAAATLSSDQFNVEVEIICSSAPKVEYKFVVFQKDGEGAEMRSSLDRNFLRQVSYQLRMDQEPAESFIDSNPPFTKQVSFQSYPISSKWTAINAASASNLTVRLFMQSGEETLTLNQTEPALRELLDKCLARQEAAVARRKIENDKRTAERKVEDERLARGREAFSAGDEEAAASLGVTNAM